MALIRYTDYERASKRAFCGYERERRPSELLINCRKFLPLSGPTRLDVVVAYPCFHVTKRGYNPRVI